MPSSSKAIATPPPPYDSGTRPANKIAMFKSATNVRIDSGSMSTHNVKLNTYGDVPLPQTDTLGGEISMFEGGTGIYLGQKAHLETSNVKIECFTSEDAKPLGRSPGSTEMRHEVKADNLTVQRFASPEEVVPQERRSDVNLREARVQYFASRGFPGGSSRNDAPKSSKDKSSRSKK